MKNKFQLQLRFNAMLRVSILFFCISLFSGYSVSAQILSYTTATNGALASTAANTTGTSLVRVNGAAAVTSACTTGFSSKTFSAATTYSTTLAAVETSVTPNTGYILNVTGFSAKMRRSATGPASVRFAYSINGGSTWIAQSSNLVVPQVACGSGSVLSWAVSFTVTSPVSLKFRIYGFNSSATGGNEQIVNLTVNGTVTASGTTCSTPSGLSATGITTSAATIGWTAVAGAASYNVQYRTTGTTAWTTVTSTTNSKAIAGLTAATGYDYQVQTVCSAGNSAYTAVSTFSTLANAIIPVPDHIVILILENHSYSSIIGSSAAPHINALATDASSALFTQSFGIEHPSQPNYLDLYSGSNQGVTNDNVPANNPFTTLNLGRSLINAGRTFITYSEDLPSVGYNGATSGNYARKHNPAANWMGTGTNQISTTTNQPFTAFPTSANYASLPTVCYVVPNQNNDMHNGTGATTITTGDNWFFNNLNAYVQWAKTHNSLLILTFDEDDASQSNQVTTIITGEKVLAGQYANHIDHYSILRTIEDMYGLPYAGNISSPINYCWKPAARNINFNNPVAATPLQNESQVTVYPNPASSIIHFKFQHLGLQPTFIKISNELRQPAGTFKVFDSQELILSTKQFASGSYFYTVTQNEKVIGKGNFIVVQ